MPSVLQVAKDLGNKHLKYAPKANQYQIKHVINIYEDRKNVPRHVVEKTVMALYLPSAFGRVGKQGKLGKADEIYEDFVSRYQDNKAYPEDFVRTLRYTDRLIEMKERLTGVESSYQLRVVLFTQARKQDPDRDPFKQDKEAERLIQKRTRKYNRAKHKGLLQYWTGYLTVQAFSDRVISQQKGKLTTRGTNEFKLLYHICMTDDNFKKRELDAPGYLDGIYVLDWSATSAKRAAPADPKETRKRASGDKVAIQFKYCSTQLDLSKRTFREALRKSSHHVSEPCINTVYDNYEQTLLRTEKKRNLITRETILDVLGRTEEDIKDGLSIEEVLPLFEKYKLKLRVYDVFYNLIHKYDPEVPNLNHRPFYCVTDGDHIYTLNKDLDSLAQKSDDDEYRVVANGNFHIPEKTVEKSNYIVMEHIDELLTILREQAKNDTEKDPRKGDSPDEGYGEASSSGLAGDRLLYMIHKADNLESVVWQLYDAGFRSNIKYGAGKLSWVSLTVNRYTFVIKSQQKIDWAIDGSMEVQDAVVFNKMHDAKADFHYHLFKSEHKELVRRAGPGDPR